MATPEPVQVQRILISIHPKRVLVHFNRQLIADTCKGLTLVEGTAPPVLYIPRDDVDMRLLTRAAYETYCPHKGTAHYYSIHAGARHALRAVWTYEQPLAGVEPIRNHLAFDELLIDRVEE